jgi:hypothetical protein
MNNESTQIYYDDKGKPMLVQMSVGEYEKLISRAKESTANKELIQKTLQMLKDAGGSL